MWENGKREGLGELTALSGMKYTGGWHDDLKHGHVHFFIYRRDK